MELSKAQSEIHLTPFGKSYYGAEREQVIHDLVAETITTSEAVDALTSHIIEDKTREMHEWTWTMILAAASTFPDANQHVLVLLVIALAARAGELSEMIEQPLKIHGSRKDCTMLEKVFSTVLEILIDLSNLRLNRREVEDGQDPKQHVIHWTIVHSLCIVLSRTSSSDHSHYSTTGIHSMSSTLEHPLDGWHIRLLRSMVPGAVAWILINGSAFYERTEGDETPFPYDRATPLWTGRPGFCKERWALWRIQFGRIAYHEDVDEQTRRIARKAEVEMHRIEEKQMSIRRKNKLVTS